MKPSHNIFIFCCISIFFLSRLVLAFLFTQCHIKKKKIYLQEVHVSSETRMDRQQWTLVKGTEKVSRVGTIFLGAPSH